jgi:PAS domain S-box-containing protein
MITIAIGQAEGIDTRSVVQDVLTQCRTQLGGVRPGAGIVFAAVHFDHQLMLDSILQAFPDLDLVGCTSAGDFATRLGFSDDAVTLMLFHSDDVEIRAGVGHHLTQAPGAAVRSAVAQARDRLSGEPQFGLAFPDGYDKHFDHILTILNQELGLDCPVFGGAAGMLWTEEQNAKQFYRNEVLEDALPLLLWAGPVEYAFGIANSWKPVGKKATVTASQGRTVGRIGSMTAVDFYRHYLGEHTEPAREFILAVSEGEGAQAYLRAPITYNPDGSITFSETVPQGAVVQLTEAIRDVILQDTRRTAEALTRDLAFQPRFGVAFSCAFRKDILGTRTPEELAILRDVLPPGLPIGGFYSFGEIAPLERRQPTRLHGATLVTLLVGQKDDAPLSAGAAADTSDVIAVGTQALPGREALATENAYLKHKLERSEAYRKRIEALKDLNAAMHRTIIGEVEEARLEILQKDAALRKSEEKYRRIVETAGEGFVLTDEHLTIVDVNEAYCRLLGYTREELLGRNPLDFTTEEYRQILLAGQEKLLEPEYRSLESVLVRKDGRHVPILIHGNRLKDDAGAVIGNMALVTDMTEHKKALALAGEVQKSLLPQKDPAIPGFDVAGRNVSCDEIGGDYFDFFWRRESPQEPFGIVVGDITGHGVDSALLMSSARAFLHMRVSQPGTVSEIVAAMNVQMVQDVLDSGRFMTLFYLVVDPAGDALHWVRAGHDPALLYDPEQDIFEELDGPGMVLGVDANYVFEESHKEGLKDGQVVAVGTDGIWEAFSKDGQMYGKRRFRELLRRHASAPARDILDAVYRDVMNFTRGRKSDDDITLVILKINRRVAVIDVPAP